MKKYYRCKYYFNALHSFDEKKENIHSHTFTIIFSVVDREHNGLFDFQKFEQIVSDILSAYRGTYLNHLPEFADVIPTVENIGEILYIKFKDRLTREGFSLYQLVISENPLEEYSISEELLLPMEYIKDCKKYWERVAPVKR